MSGSAQLHVYQHFKKGYEIKQVKPSDKMVLKTSLNLLNEKKMHEKVCVFHGELCIPHPK